ncbi:MAG: hypothetical protein ACPHJ3_16265 [Rubripirellula sp.]
MPRKAMTRDEWRTLIAKCEQEFKDFQGTVSVRVSGGAASSVAWKRCLDKYGHDRVRPVFADTKTEHTDLYRFLDDCERAFDQKIERLCDGRDIWDVFDAHGIMRIPKAGNACKASIELKQKPLDKWFKSSDCDAIAVGIEFLEPERIAAFTNRLSGTVLFPLCDRPLLSECEIVEEVRKWGIDPPQLYKDDYTHNNCGGFCILAGLGQWAANRKRDPDGFAYHADRERRFNEKTGFPILRDQSGGEVKPYTLDQLAKDQDEGREFPDNWRSQCGCMSPQLFAVDDCF